MRGIKTGGEFYAVMRITSTDSSVETDLGITLEAEINGVVAGGSFNGKLKDKNQEGQSRSEFSCQFFQRGGAGAPEIGATLSLDEIKIRLHDFPDAVAKHPFPYEIEVATYDTIPIPLPTKEQRDDFLLALADADQQKLRFLQTRNDLTFAAEHPEFFDNPPEPKVLQAAAGIFLQAANAAIAHAVKLSQGEINPPQLFDPAKATPPISIPTVPSLRKKTFGLQKSFADWWVSKDDPATLLDDKRLVNRIGNKAIPSISDFDDIKDPRGDDAKTLSMQGKAPEAVVKNFQSMDLSGGFLEENRVKSVGHLPGMLPLSLTELDLSLNELSDVRGLEPFTNLKSLNLSRNFISDLTPLQALVNLEVLDISANNISEVSALKSLTKLRTLTLDTVAISTSGMDLLIRNPLADISALRDNPAIANPFVLGDNLSVRLGKLADGDEAQFTGTATRIGRSNKFTVDLTRGTETKDDEWTFLGVGSGDELGMPDLVFINVFVKSTKEFVGSQMAGDRRRTAASKNNFLGQSFDAAVVAIAASG